MTNYDLDIHYEDGEFIHEFFDDEGNICTDKVDKETSSILFQTCAYDLALQLRFLEDTRMTRAVEFAKEDYTLFSNTSIDLSEYRNFASIAHVTLFSNNEFTFDGTLDTLTFSKKRWVIKGFILYTFLHQRATELTETRRKILELLSRVQGSEMEDVYKRVLKGESVKI